MAKTPKVEPIHITYSWDDRNMLMELNQMDLSTLGERKIRNAIRAELKVARTDIIEAAKGVVPNDPRNAHLGVRKIVYRKGLGGNVSLFNRSRVKTMGIYSNPHPGGMSGIRRHRKVSKRTKQLNGYTGADRAFILRFVEDGTDGRWTKNLRYQAYRGVIRPKPFFKSASTTALNNASDRFNVRLEKMIRRAVKAQAKQGGNLK